MAWSTSQCSTTLPVVVEAEDVDAGIAVITRPRLAEVQHDVAILGDGALEVDALVRVLGCHALEVVEGLFASPTWGLCWM